MLVKAKTGEALAEAEAAAKKQASGLRKLIDAAKIGPTHALKHSTGHS